MYLSKSKITDKKNYLKKYKYTKKLLNYSNASKCNSLLSTSESKNINVIIIGEMIWVFFCLFVFLKLVFVVFSCMLYLENDNFESIYDLFDGFLSFFTFSQTVLQSLHLPKNNSLYVLTPDIAPSASTSQSRYVFCNALSISFLNWHEAYK